MVSARMSIPLEAVELILNKIEDPIELIRLKDVSKEWRAMIKRVLKKFDDKWFQLSIEIDPSARALIYSVMNIAEPKYSYDVNSDYWALNPKIGRTIYCSWMKWQMCMERCASLIQPADDLPSSFPHDEPIISIAVNNFIIAVATSTTIYFYYVLTMRKSSVTINYETRYKDRLSQIALWYTGGKRICVTKSAHIGVVKFFHINKNAQEIMSEKTITEILCTGWGQCFSVNYNNIIQYGFACDMVYVIAEVRLSLLMNERVVAMHPEDDTLIVLITDGTATTYKKIIIDDKCLKDQSDRTDPLYLPEEFEYVDEKHFNIFSQTVTMAISGSKLIFSTMDKQEKWYEYDTLGIFNEIVTSAVFHANILILGMNSGTVEILPVKRVSDLQKLHSLPLVRKKIFVDEVPIIFLKITEVFGKQFIIAGTVNHVYAIQFYDAF